LKVKNLNIGITMRIVETEEYSEKRDALSQDWPKFLNSFNINPIYIPNSFSIVKNMFDNMKFDGIILSGGSDIGKYPERDRIEFEIIKHAIKNEIPVFGVCRGLQIINRFFGGSEKKTIDKKHVKTKHHIQILDTKIEQQLGKKEFLVNSFHDNILIQQNLGQDLTPFGLCKEDSTIEGILHNEFPIMGVMWHPERESIDEDHKIISNFFNKTKN